MADLEVLSSECFFSLFFFLFPKGTFDLFLFTAVSNIISLVGRLLSRAPFTMHHDSKHFSAGPQLESNPPYKKKKTLVGLRVFVSPHSVKKPPMFLCHCGGEANTISLTAPLNWSERFNFETPRKDESETSPRTDSETRAWCRFLC